MGQPVVPAAEPSQRIGRPAQPMPGCKVRPAMLVWSMPPGRAGAPVRSQAKDTQQLRPNGQALDAVSVQQTGG
jgi:hypothetical protein